MMQYESAEMEVIYFDTEDVIAASGITGNGDDDSWDQWSDED